MSVRTGAARSPPQARGGGRMPLGSGWSAVRGTWALGASGGPGGGGSEDRVRSPKAGAAHDLVGVGLGGPDVL